MQNYLNQLVEDIEKAQAKSAPNYALLHPNHPALDYGLDYIVEWEMAERTTFADFFSMAVEAFPPAERLTETQQKQVIEASLELWAKNRMNVVCLPEDAPTEKIYTFIVKMWREYKTHSTSNGTFLDYWCICDLDLENCFWGEHCTCKDLDFGEMETAKDDPDGLPF